MNRLTEEQIKKAKSLTKVEDISTEQILELIAYYNWDKFGIEEVNRLFPDIKTVEELIDKLLVVGINQVNFNAMMMNYHQANTWFIVHEAQRQYENHLTEIEIDKSLTINQPIPN